MVGIQEYLDKILAEPFILNMRQAIHDGIEKAYEDATFDGNTNMEVARARGTHNTLNNRLDHTDRTKADQTFVDAQFSSIVSGSPKGTFSNLTALQEAYPNGTEGIFLVLSNGHWYYWNQINSNWSDGGIFQASEIQDGGVTRPKLSDDILDTKFLIPHELAPVLRTENWDATGTSLQEIPTGLRMSTGITATYSRMNGLLNRDINKGDTVLFRVKIKVLNTESTNFRFLLRQGTSGTIYRQELFQNPNANEEYDLYYYHTFDSDVINPLYLIVDTQYSNASLGRETEVTLAQVLIVSDYYPSGLIPSIEEFVEKITRNEDLFVAQDIYKNIVELESKSFSVEESNNVSSSLVEFVKKADGTEVYQTVDNFKYPQTLTWGNEYLHSWYAKLVDDQDLKMVWAGDSTTGNESINNPEFRRNALGKRILTLSGYDSEKITSLNHGHGGNTTQNWLDIHLENDMLENPDIYIWAYGLNDGGTNYYPGTTIQQRLNGFEQRLREGLGRIRSDGDYNLSAQELPIILCTPVTTDNEARSRTKEKWHNYVRPIIKKACRDYHCAFIDLAAYQYDRTYGAYWSTNNDNVHPNHIATTDYMSLFKDLLLPYLLQK